MVPSGTKNGRDPAVGHHDARPMRRAERLSTVDEEPRGWNPTKQVKAVRCTGDAPRRGLGLQRSVSRIIIASMPTPAGDVLVLHLHPVDRRDGVPRPGLATPRSIRIPSSAARRSPYWEDPEQRLDQAGEERRDGPSPRHDGQVTARKKKKTSARRRGLPAPPPRETSSTIASPLRASRGSCSRPRPLARPRRVVAAGKTSALQSLAHGGHRAPAGGRVGG